MIRDSTFVVGFSLGNQWISSVAAGWNMERSGAGLSVGTSLEPGHPNIPTMETKARLRFLRIGAGMGAREEYSIYYTL